MVISFDLDEVLAEFQTGWIEFNKRNYNEHYVLDDFYIYDYMKVMGITQEEAIKRIFEFYESEIFADLQPTKGAEEVVCDLAKKHELFVISSRSDELKGITQRWLEKHFPNCFKEILLIGEVTKAGYNYTVTKGKLCREYGVNYHIDDAPHHVAGILEAGTKVIVYERPWNRNYDFGQMPVLRCKKFSELPEILTK